MSYLTPSDLHDLHSFVEQKNNNNNVRMTNMMKVKDIREHYICIIV